MSSLDAKFRESVSGNCTTADRIVRKIRQREWDTTWRQEDGTYPGQMFGLARERITTTVLWNVTRRMPKGALLHAHLTAMLPFDKLLKIVLETPGMHVRSTASLALENQRQNASVYFKYIDTNIPNTAEKSPIVSDVSVNSVGYVPDRDNEKDGGWWPVEDAADNFRGGRQAFSNFVVSKMTLQPEDARRHDLGVDEVWKRFEPFFDQGGTMLEYEPVVRQFWIELFQELVEDRISWVEIRASGSNKITPNGTTTNMADPGNPDFWWTIFREQLNGFKAARARLGNNTVDPFNGARVIYSQARGAEKKKIKDSESHYFHIPLVFLPDLCVTDHTGQHRHGDRAQLEAKAGTQRADQRLRPHRAGGSGPHAAGPGARAALVPRGSQGKEHHDAFLLPRWRDARRR